MKRLFRMEADMLPLASRMPVSMASLLRSDSVNPLRNSSNYRGQRENHIRVCCTGKLRRLFQSYIFVLIAVKFKTVYNPAGAALISTSTLLSCSWHTNCHKLLSLTADNDKTCSNSVRTVDSISVFLRHQKLLVRKLNQQY